MCRDKYLMSVPVSSWWLGRQALQQEAWSPCHFALLSGGAPPMDFEGYLVQAAPQPGQASGQAQEWTRAVPRGTGDLSSRGLCLQTFLT